MEDDGPMDEPRDELTGVLAYHALATLRPQSRIVLVDLVHFMERFNYPYGHVVGDRILKEVGTRLRDGLAPLRVFRAGGDEFIVEADSGLDEAGAEALAHRIAGLLALPIEWLEQQPIEWGANLPALPTEAFGQPLEARIGVSLGPVGGDWLQARLIAERAADDAGRQGRLVVIATP